MTKVAERIYLLGGQPREPFRFPLPVSKLRKLSEIHEAILQAPKYSSAWIATRPDSTDDFLREAWTVSGAQGGSRRRLGRMLLLFPPRPDSLPALEDLFDAVAWGTASFRLLPHTELVEVWGAATRHDLFIGGFVDSETETLVLYRGDFERLVVPLSIFQAFGDGPEPDPSALSLLDCGQTVGLGDYQAASDAILYEVDADYRRRINARRRQEDKSFGACLRRLRVLKGLRQSDFGTITAKTIARIERCETGNPHRATLRRIAKRLGVGPEEIESY
jgi:hypothetical protein